MWLMESWKSLCREDGGNVQVCKVWDYLGFSCLFLLLKGWTRSWDLWPLLKKKKCDLLGWGHLVYTSLSLSQFLVFNKTKPEWTDGFVMVVCLLLEIATLHAFFFFLLQGMFCFVLFLLEATKGCWGYFWLLWRPKGNSIVLENEHKCFPVML